MTPIQHTYVAMFLNYQEVMIEAPYIEKAREIAEAEAIERNTKVIQVRRW